MGTKLQAIGMPAPRQVSDEEILEIFGEGKTAVLTTAEIAEELPISRRAALNRLDSLAEEGKVYKKQVGGRNVVWYLPQ